MAQNDFKPFAIGSGANVTSQADWEALTALATGFQSGTASSAQVNKAIRQASFIAAALAQYTSDKTEGDVLDDGDQAAFITKMTAAFGKDFQPLDATLTALAGLTGAADKLPYFNGEDTAALTALTAFAREILAQSDAAGVLSKLGLEDLPATFGDAASMDVGTTAGTVAAGDDSRFDMMLGVNQTYQDVLSSRVANTVYTNSTGKPIFIVVSGTQDTRDVPILLKATIDNKEISMHSYGSTAIATLTLPVPNGSTYKINASNGSNPRITTWLELRA